MIQKRTRNELYNKFRQGAIPSGADFADFIRSELNLLDDGVDTPDDPKDPICLKGHGEDDSFLDLADAEGLKRWRISGRNEEKTEEGLNIKADEKSKLYLDRDTGNVGVGTDKPSAKLHIIQTGADDVVRIEDESSDTTPFVITSDGQVGIGVGSGDERPQAKLHISYNESGDVLRVDDTSNDTTPFIIDQNGNVGIGCAEPQAKLTIMGGGVSIGNNTKQPGSNSLYVEGNLEVAGAVVVNGGSGGIEINGPLTAKTEKLTLKDNVEIVAGDSDDPEKHSDGNLSVAGDTTLGTYNQNVDDQNVVTINGRIESGGIPSSSTSQQTKLEINRSLIIDRESLDVQVKGDFSVGGDKTTLGDNQATAKIYLNGTIQREDNRDVTIDNKLLVKQNSTLESALIKSLVLNTGATVNEISTDVGLSDSSNAAVPTEHAVKEYIDNLLVGSVTAFAMASPPEGWLECNGQQVSRTTYARLFAKIGTAYGAGNGGTTFNLPNLQDEFIRGWNHSRGLGSTQESAFQNHIHNFTGTSSTTNSYGHSHSYTGGSYANAASGGTAGVAGRGTSNTSHNTHSHSFTPAGTISNPTSGNHDSETRPHNMALMFCIKY
jgi:microcystin-dependent protein